MYSACQVRHRSVMSACSTLRLIPLGVRSRGAQVKRLLLCFHRNIRHGRAHERSKTQQHLSGRSLCIEMSRARMFVPKNHAHTAGKMAGGWASNPHPPMRSRWGGPPPNAKIDFPHPDVCFSQTDSCPCGFGCPPYPKVNRCREGETCRRRLYVSPSNTTALYKTRLHAPTYQPPSSIHPPGQPMTEKLVRQRLPHARIPKKNTWAETGL
jgi:hypothetical protein